MRQTRYIGAPETMVQFALYNIFNGKLRPRILEDEVETPEGEKIVYKPIIDENGIAIYTAPVRIAKRSISQRSDRYYLYNSDPIEVQIEQTDGSNKWIKFYSHYYEVKKVEKGIDPDNKEVIFEDKIIWHEDKTGKLHLKKK